MRHMFLCQSLAVALVLVLATSPAVGQLLPDCTIDFEFDCPDAAPVCGADFDGGQTCIFAGLPFCYSSGFFSYGVTDATPLTIQLSGDMTSLDVFFASQGPGPVGEMRFFDAPVGGNEVGLPLTTNGDCLLLMPAMQLVSFDAPVRRVEVTVTGGTVWIDDFRVNPLPPPIPTVSEWGLMIMALLLLTCAKLYYGRHLPDSWSAPLRSRLCVNDA
ncbi:MAG: hypothetical protein IIB61_07270 [Planctomycetes bacterium]|nr:hypothetical protein [Planctomycetota bacterium]